MNRDELFCKNCAYFKEKKSEYNVKTRFCTRYPPQIIVTEYGYKSKFPEVDEYGYCGEFKNCFEEWFKAKRSEPYIPIQEDDPKDR